MTRNVNLYDPSLRERHDLLGIRIALATVASMLFAVLLGAGAASWSAARLEPIAAAVSRQLQQEQAAAQALAARAASSKPDTALQAAIAKAQQALLQRRGALQSLAASAVDRGDGFSERLEALARQSLDGLWLTGMTLHDDDVFLKGRTLRPALIPDYVQRLDQEPSLQGRAFKALDVTRPLEGDARSGPAAAAASAAGADGDGPRHAEFVEFTLVGAGGAEPAAAGSAAGKDGKP